MENINAFFNNRNKVSSLTDDDYKRLTSDYLAPIRAFARATYAGIYVIDYLNRGFEFVSENPLFLCGNTPDEVLRMGYSFYFKHVPKSDLNLLLTINDLGFDFFERIPIKERILYTISYDFHLISIEEKPILINQKLTPIFLDNEGKMWKALCLVSLSSEKNPGNIRIYKKGDNKVHEYDTNGRFWKCSEKIILSKREKEILHFSSRGYTINEIAEVIFISADTVKFHRRKLFEKLQVANISEAITYAENNKLI